MILIRLMGGLGNQMFQYAFGKKLALKNNASIYFDTFLLHDHSSDDPYSVHREFELDVFKFPVKFVSKHESEKFNGRPSAHFLGKIQNRIIRSFKPLRLIIEPDRAFHPEILDTPDNYCFVGSWQSYKYFEDIRSDVIKDFEIKEELLCHPNYTHYYERIKGAACPVSMQIRRGDYVSNPVYRDILGAQNIDYYKKAYFFLLKKNPDITLFVFSDEIEWCKKNIKFTDKLVFVEQEKSKRGVASDLKLMTLCFHHIISNSSFSWWGAWLGEYSNKIVCVPLNWVNPKYSDNFKIHAIDNIPNDWIRI
jgi:hypothetical protein